jgi:septation ring formation regulator EzrA
MNTLRTLFIIVLISATPFAVLQAQSSTTASSTKTDGGILNSVLQDVTVIKEKIQGATPQENPALQKKSQTRIINLAANLSNRFDGIIYRLENISGRLNARIEKQASAGYDVSAARTSLEAANKALKDAKQQMNGIDEAVIGAIGSTNPRDEWKNVRTRYTSTRDSIKIAYTELKNTVTNLKNAPHTTPSAPATTTKQKVTQ